MKNANAISRKMPVSFLFHHVLFLVFKVSLIENPVQTTLTTEMMKYVTLLK